MILRPGIPFTTNYGKAFGVVLAHPKDGFVLVEMQNRTRTMEKVEVISIGANMLLSQGEIMVSECFIDGRCIQ